MAYGRTNKYKPVKKSKASGATAKRPTEVLYFFCAMATLLMMTAAVKAMDSQRWVCRIHLFQFNGTSSEVEPEADRAHRPVLRDRGACRHSLSNRPTRAKIRPEWPTYQLA
jgi:hypothetical protein